MKRASALALLFVLAAALLTTAGCVKNDRVAQPTEGETQPAATVETLEAWLEEHYAGEEWHDAITAIEPVTRLRKPFALVFLPMPSSDPAFTTNEPGNSWANSEYGSELGVRFIFSDGQVLQGGMPLYMEFAEEVPPSPDSADGFMEWLDVAYGQASGDPVGEAWYDRIQGAERNAERNALLIRTDLDQNDPADAEIADTIGAVARLSRPADVETWIVRYGDGAWELSSSFR